MVENIQKEKTKAEADPVHAFEEKSVVGHSHRSPQCSSEWAEIGDVVGWRIKQA